MTTNPDGPAPAGAGAGGSVPPRRRRHLSLLEVAIVLMVLASISLFAIPRIQSRRLLTNEGEAQELLRRIHAAQEQFLQANDGATYGFLGELLGDELRSGVRVKPRLLVAPGLKSFTFAHIKDGYLFTIALPGRGVPAVTHDRYANADFDRLGGGYLAYAWPVMAGYSGRRVYVIDQTGALRQYANDQSPPYSGVDAPPPLDFGATRGGPFGDPPAIARERRLEPVGS
jgi:hypothetical protein